MTANHSTAGRWFAEEWAKLLATVLESLAGERPQLTCAPPAAPLPAASEEIARQHGAIWWWKQHLPLPGEPSLWIGAPQHTWSQLAGRILGAAGVEDESQARETYVEILQQSCGELARSAGRLWNRQVDAPAKEAAGAPADGEYYRVEGAFADAALPPMLAVITGNPQEPAREVERLAEAVSSPKAAEPGGMPPHVESRTFDLLLGVELPVSVSFGHVQLPLKEVLKLAAGSIIELNRTVDEPVEVIVNNCVVARGEVVVVEGNYGVRIHQILSRRERLENLP